MHCAKHRFFEKPRFGALEFLIKHYAGKVAYTVTGFLEKAQLGFCVCGVWVCVANYDAHLSRLGARCRLTSVAEHGLPGGGAADADGEFQVGVPGVPLQEAPAARHRSGAPAGLPAQQQAVRHAGAPLHTHTYTHTPPQTNTQTSLTPHSRTPTPPAARCRAAAARRR